MKQGNLTSFFSNTKKDKSAQKEILNSVPKTESKPELSEKVEDADPVVKSSKKRRLMCSDDEDDERNKAEAEGLIQKVKNRFYLEPPGGEKEDSNVEKIEADLRNLSPVSPTKLQTEQKMRSDDSSQKVPPQAGSQNDSVVYKANHEKLKPLNDKKFHPITDCPFEKNSAIPFSFMVSVFDEVSNLKGENSKEQIKDLLANMFRVMILNRPEALVPAYFLCVLKLEPDYISSELGIGDSILVKAISKSSGRSEKHIREAFNQIGDLGTVAAQSKSSQSTMDSFFKKKSVPVQLSIENVYDALRKISLVKGNSAETEKEGILMKLFFNCKGEEMKYIVRWIQKNLKIGAAEASMQSALAKAFFITTANRSIINYREKLTPNEFSEKFEKFENTIKRAICEFPNEREMIKGLVKVGHNIDALLDICKITPGVPVKPMLAKPTKDISVILKRFENMDFTCEFKYDGLRGQIHYAKGKCDIFSRNLLNMTEAYPDIIKNLAENISPTIDNFIIDSEIVAFETKTNRILPFQQLTSRGKKNVSLNQIEVNVCIFIFDILYLNGKSLLQETFESRRDYILKNFKEVENKIAFATHKNTNNFEEIEEFLNLSVKIGCEGLMVKTLNVNSTYEPAKRSFKWLKLKKDYLDKGMGDTLDLVPIGGFFGTGKRTGLYGSFLLACFNPDMERFETTCKIGTGFSEEILEKIHKMLSEKVIKHPLPEYKINEFEVDVWFEPHYVWEIKGADLQISPVYTAGLGEVDEKRGIGLRFPRLIRIREDKDPKDATTTEFIVDIYKSQAVISNNQDFRDDDDMY